MTNVNTNTPKTGRLSKAAKAAQAAQEAANLEVVAPQAEVVAPAAAPAKRQKVVKDLTKRDVVILVSHANKVAFITTNLQFSGVDAERASSLLVKDMTMRAVPGTARAEKFAPLLTATDMCVERPLLQVTEAECQLKKFEEHNKLAAQGYTMLSTRGRGEDVRNAIAQIAAMQAQNAETVTETA